MTEAELLATVRDWRTTDRFREESAFPGLRSERAEQVKRERGT